MIALLERQRPEHDGFTTLKIAVVAPKPQRERQHRDGREARLASEQGTVPEIEAEVPLSPLLGDSFVRRIRHDSASCGFAGVMPLAP